MLVLSSRQSKISLNLKNQNLHLLRHKIFSSSVVPLLFWLPWMFWKVVNSLEIHPPKVLHIRKNHLQNSRRSSNANNCVISVQRNKSFDNKFRFIWWNYKMIECFLVFFKIYSWYCSLTKDVKFEKPNKFEKFFLIFIGIDLPMMFLLLLNHQCWTGSWIRSIWKRSDP